MAPLYHCGGRLEGRTERAVVSGGRDLDRASEGDERTLGRVEGVRDAERDRLVAARVTEGGAEHERDPERREALRDTLVAPFRRLADAEESSDDHPLPAL